MIEGHSAVDESSITGEPLPVDKSPGETVISGTLNQNGGLLVRVTTIAASGTIAEIIKAVEDARMHKSSLENFGERFGSIYTPAMFAVALAVASVPVLLGLYWATWFYRGLVVLVISCSCGLILSVPVATLTAITDGARRGLVIKGGAFLEAASRVDTLVLDKTGTLTLGQPEVSEVRAVDGYSTDEVLALASAVEAGSEHPLARAVLERNREKRLTVLPGTDFEAVPGKGASAMVQFRANLGRRGSVGFRKVGWTLRVGSHFRRSSGETVLLVWNRSGLIGAISVGDTVRPEARGAIATLRSDGFHRVIMLTGDERFAAEAVARSIGGIEVPRRALAHRESLGGPKVAIGGTSGGVRRGWN